MPELYNHITIPVTSPQDELLTLREQLPTGYGATPETMAAIAWEQGDDEAAAFAFGIADQIKALRKK